MTRKTYILNMTVTPNGISLEGPPKSLRSLQNLLQTALEVEGVAISNII